MIANTPNGIECNGETFYNGALLLYKGKIRRVKKVVLGGIILKGLFDKKPNLEECERLYKF